MLTTLSLTMFLGFLALAVGFVGGIRAVQDYGSSSFWGSFIGSLLFLLLGIVLLNNPLVAMLSLTMIISIYLAVEGLAKLYLSWKLRGRDRWFLLAISGLASFLLAVLVWSGWPESSTYFIGLMFGINMIFSGTALVGLGMTGRAMEKSGGRA